MLRILAGALLVLALLVVTFHREIPFWQSGGTTSVIPSFVGFDSGTFLCPKDGQTFEVRGDSLVAGLRMGAPNEAASAYGKLAERELGRGIRVVLHGQGGATAATGLASWQGIQPQGEIVLLAYGTNDAAARGWIGGKEPVPLAEFSTSLSEHIRDARLRGAVVGLIAPPPLGSSAMADRLQPYRQAVEEVGRTEGVSVFDPAEAFAECQDQEPLLARDALHLNVGGHACLGNWLAQRLCSSTAGRASRVSHELLQSSD